MKKKIGLIVFLFSAIFLVWCNNGVSVSETLVNEAQTWKALLSEKTQKYTYNWKMEKPDISEISNLKYFEDWYREPWTKKVGSEILEWKDYLSECEDISLVTSDWSYEKKLSKDELKKWNIEVSSNYDWAWLRFNLENNQKEFLNKHGWIVFNPGEDWKVWSSEIWILDQEEWWLYYETIGWFEDSYMRYPYNTVLVTSDMLLHFYHKIFSNSLRYYEESVARKTMQTLSENMFNKFSNLHEENRYNVLAPFYSFAVAYWSVPYSLLVPQEDIEQTINSNWSNQEDEWWDMWNDLGQKDVEKLITKRLETIQNKIPEEYQEIVKSTINSILKATEDRAEDKIIKVFADNVDNPIDIKQDYTQFTPRWHYTDSSLLRTYFMWMKWFMREKLHFNDMQQTKASLIMVNNIKNNELSDFNKLYDFIGKLIWQDDDVNISDLQKYISNKWRIADDDIMSYITQEDQENLKWLRPQKIMSTHYKTETIWEVTEEVAKDETAWFVFFGEKFTIDSFFFDKMTAGSAENENTYKPSLQTSFIVPEILINTGIIRDVVNLWMTRATTKYDIDQQQIKGYDKAKSEITNELKNFDFNISTYHKRLNSLSWLFAINDHNTPYFMLDPLYRYKDLNTFQWSYSELKHDTILYAKQAYAEMWDAWSDDCAIVINPPDLPVPKWYVEPNIDFIDSLLKLTNDSKEFFKEDDSYSEFTKYLSFIKDIAIKQSKNQIIDDETFEKLRLYYSDITNILYPKKVIDGDNDFISALIADIFTSENNWPLYIATWRPHLMMVNIKDANWARAVIWPVYSTYEFYDSDQPISRSQWRYTDDDRQKWYDSLNEKAIYTIPMEKLLEY